MVKRSSWLRGDDLESALLRSSDDKMCCLGFYSLACGYEENDIVDAACPSDLFDISKYPSFFFKNNCQHSIGIKDSDAATDLMIINDSTKFSDQEREEKLIQIFAKMGIEVIFED